MHVTKGHEIPWRYIVRENNQKKFIYGLAFICLTVFLFGVLRYQHFGWAGNVCAVLGIVYGLFWAKFIPSKSMLVIWTHPIVIYVCLLLVALIFKFILTPYFHVAFLNADQLVAFIIASCISAFGFGFYAAAKEIKDIN